MTGARAQFDDAPKLPRSLWVVVAAVALAVRLYRLDHFSYWLDEIMQSFFIHGTWAQFWSSLRFDAVHPPLDYLFDRVFESCRPDDAARRLLPVIWGTGAVLLVMALVARRAGRAAGILAGLFLALAPFHVRYSQEFRPYSLGLFLVLLALALLEHFLQRPSAIRLVGLFLASLATMYALYLGALVLAIAGAALLVEDALSASDTGRQSSARRFLRWSPIFVGLLVVGYLPWLAVVREAARRIPPTAPPELTLARLQNVLAFFGPGSGETDSLGIPGIAYFALAAAGIIAALRQRGLRFLVVWIVAGTATIEILEQLHPHFYAPRHFLPAAVAIPAAVGLAVAKVGRSNLMRLATSALLLGGIVSFDARGLREYFRSGRPDWRPLGAYLRATPATELIITENAYAQLCVAYYVVGPGWLHRSFSKSKEGGRSIIALNGDPTPIAWLWQPGKTAWLVLHGARWTSVKRWAEPYPGISFPTAEGGAIVKRLDRRRER